MALKPLSPKDYQRLKPFFKHQPYSLCSYSLLSIIVWQNDDYGPCAQIRDETLIIATDFAHQPEKRYLLLPVGFTKEYSPASLADLGRELDYPRFWFVPESYIETHSRKEIESHFVIEPHPQYDDYIYNKSDLAELSGNRFAKKRNLIKQFQREYVDRGRVIIEKVTPAAADECTEFIEAWCQERRCDADEQSDLACEKQAILNTIWDMADLEANGLLLRIDGKISAFGIGSYLTDEMGVLHFEKAFSNIKGLYQYFDNLCARRLFPNVFYINKESDMGEANLARAKKSYHPVKMIRSYQLILRA